MKCKHEIPVRIGVPLPKCRDNMVPCTPDVRVITKVLDHSSLADGLNPGSLLRLHEKIKALVPTPSKVWHNPVKAMRQILIQCR